MPPRKPAKKTNNKTPVRRRSKARKTRSVKVKKAPALKRKAPIWFKLIILLSFVSFLISGLIWRQIDSRVRHRLSSLHNPSLPVIYSSPFDLTSYISRLGEDSERNRQLLRTELTERRYTEVSGQPRRPGDFSLSESGIRIFTRPYVDYSGTQLDGQQRTLPWDANTPNQRRTTVEPQVISYIGSADTRASSFVPLQEIPTAVQYAVLSIEDERFYSHFGLDPISIIRAAVRNVYALRLVEGGSTLTQQLAKNLFLSPKRSFSRKLQEIPTALSIEKNLSKSGILELYLNEVYLGQEGAVAIHGMPEAASAFFGKKLQDITIEEAATLAGIIKAPSIFNPRRHPQRAKERRDIVLRKMRELGHISATALQTALVQPLRTVARQEHRRLAPYFIAALESELSQVLDLEAASRSGLAVHTGLDLGLQRCAETAIREGLQKLESTHRRLTKSKRQIEAALVAIEPYSGLIKAWVGGRDFASSQFNRVNQAYRQIGSTIKPFLYLTALDGSLNSYKVATATSILEDKPMEIQIRGQKSWNPENYDHDYRGDVSLRYALENSLNMPALYVAERIGLSAVKRTVQQFGLSSRNFSAVPSLALGALDTDLLRLTNAYAAIANGGVFITPRLYSAALDGENGRLSAPRVLERRVADEAATFVLTNILQGVLDRGTGKGVRTSGFKGTAAGKTGTSDSARDAWFVGFTPTLSAGIWVGFDDNRPMNLSGGVAAAPIWGRFMSCAQPYITSSNFIPSRDVVFLPVDKSSGLLASESCPQADVIQEVFVRGTEPSKRCPHQTNSEDYPIPPQDGQPRDQPGNFWSRFLP